MTTPVLLTPAEAAAILGLPAKSLLREAERHDGKVTAARPATQIDKALAYKERCERAGYAVRRVILDGKRIELVFDGDGPQGDDFDLVEMKR